SSCAMPTLQSPEKLTTKTQRTQRSTKKNGEFSGPTLWLSFVVLCVLCVFVVNRSGSLLAEFRQRLDKLAFLLEHRQVAAVGDQLQLRVLDVLLVGPAIGGRHQAVVLAPEQQRGALNAVQPLGQLGVIRPFPH